MLLHGERLDGVKPELAMLVIAVAVRRDVMVTCGLRTPVEQQRMVQEGKSQTLHSKHLTGDAVDLAVLDKDGKVTWEFGAYADLAQMMKSTSKQRGVSIVWGGDWQTLRDGPHFELAKGTVAV